MPTAKRQGTSSPTTSTADCKRMDAAVKYRPSLRGRAVTESSVFTRRKTKHSLKKFAEMRNPTVSVEEYEALPTSIQEKCFSPVERLRIAEQATVLKRTSKPSKASCGDSPFSENINRLSPSRRPSEPTTRRARKDSTNIDVTNISTAEAAWYLSLPDKIRKQHLTRDEEFLLTQQCGVEVATTSGYLNTRSVYDRGVDNASIPTRRSISVIPTAGLGFDQVHFGDFSLHDTGESAEMEIFRMYAQRRKSTASILSSRPQSSATTKHASFRRTLSMTSVDKRPRSSPAPPLPCTPLAWSFPKDSRSVARHAEYLQPPTPLPEAKYYQDPEARQKLRVYLASPQRFDEALEFGFPLQSPESQRSLSSSNDRNRAENKPYLFDKDDSSSVYTNDVPEHFRDDNHFDGESASESEGPITPPSNAFTFRPMVTKHHTAPSSSSLQRPSIRKNTSIDQHPPFDFGQREMTLRLTLTRPDLRAPEDELYGWQRNLPHCQDEVGGADTLVLQQLHKSVDVTGSYGAFAAGHETEQRTPKGIGRFWQRLKKL